MNSKSQLSEMVSFKVFSSSHQQSHILKVINYYVFNSIRICENLFYISSNKIIAALIHSPQRFLLSDLSQKRITDSVLEPEPSLVPESREAGRPAFKGRWTEFVDQLYFWLLQDQSFFVLVFSGVGKEIYFTGLVW